MRTKDQGLIGVNYLIHIVRKKEGGRKKKKNSRCINGKKRGGGKKGKKSGNVVTRSVPRSFNPPFLATRHKKKKRGEKKRAVEGYGFVFFAPPRGEKGKRGTETGEQRLANIQKRGRGGGGGEGGRGAVRSPDNKGMCN